MKKEEEEEQTAVLTADMKTNPSVKYLTNIVHMGEVQAETVPQEIGTKEAAQGQSDYVDTLSRIRFSQMQRITGCISASVL